MTAYFWPVVVVYVGAAAFYHVKKYRALNPERIIVRNSDLMRISDWFKDWANEWGLDSASIDKLPVEVEPVDGWAVLEEGSYMVVHVIMRRKES